MLGRKITHLERHKVAHAVAGDDLTDEIGYALSAALDSGNLAFGNALETSLRDMVADKISELRGTHPHLTEEYGVAVERTLLVVFYGDQVPTRQLWRVRIGGVDSAKIVDGIVIIGAMGNTARFFEHYFQANIPVDRLLTLGSHIVLMGHWIDSLMIEGLDVAVADDAGFRFFDEKQKAPLVQRSTEIDGLIRNSLLADQHYL
jgi:hypothetical protein